jgi:sugar/nucleoside kinase (ribokinase family)
MRKGICVAGNLIVDFIYPIDCYPAEGELTTIRDGITQSTGGAVCNVLTDLALLDDQLPLQALGRIGDEAAGDFKFQEYRNVDAANLIRGGLTSFTAVMSDEVNRSRTFFHFRGANAEFSEADIDWEKVNAVILHIGYILLLDKLDEPDGIFGTRMARLLATAQTKGIKTSIDVVSESGSRFREIATPALRYTDYCIINEIEAERITGIQLRSEHNEFLEDQVDAALDALFELGVSTWAVIHSPEGGYGRSREGEYAHRASLKLPAGFIKGTVGAGDAFCAGMLYGAYQKASLSAAIELGIAAATCSLSAPGSTEGLRSAEQAKALYRQYSGHSS